MEGLIQFAYLPTQSQLADVFKNCIPSHFKELLSKLGFFEVMSSSTPNLGGV